MDTILVHPTYFPSIVQMAAIANAKKVIFEVCDNYQKQTYRNRCYIAHTNGKLLLNVPVKHSKDGHRQKMNEVTAENAFPWQKEHWRSIQNAYRTSPFFEFYEDELAPLFLESVTSLLDLNIKIFETLSDMLQLEVPITRSITYQIAPQNCNDLRKLVNAKSKQEYALTPYTQVLESQHGWLPDLSVLDLLFNEGPNALHYLENQDLNFNHKA